MNSILKYEIKSDIRDIIAEIDYEEYMFNKIFKTHVTFKNSYKKFNLIEALAENIASEVLEKFTLINQIMVRVKKPEAPVSGMFDYFGVEIRRDRNE